MWSRRRLLRTLAAGSAVAAGPVVAAAPLWGGGLARAGFAPDPARLVMVFARGGWDTTYDIDPKDGSGADVPDGAIETFGDLRVLLSASRPNTAAFFEANAFQSAVIHGVDSRSIAHPECQRRFLTGVRGTGNPDMGAIVGSQLGGTLPLPYVDLSGLSNVGDLAVITGRTGRYNQIAALLDPAGEHFEAPASEPHVLGQFLSTPDEADLAAQWLRDRANLRASAAGGGSATGQRLAAYLEANERGRDLEAHAASFGSAGRSLDPSAQVTLLLDLLQSKVSNAVLCEPTDQFDTHDNNDDQAALHEELFGFLGELAAGLLARGLDDTLVVVMSELGRTPRLNSDGGKDHWPYTSQLLFGAGVAGGASYGETDEGLLSQPIDLESGAPDDGGVIPGFDHFVAGVLDRFGVDTEPFLPGVAPLRAFHG